MNVLKAVCIVAVGFLLTAVGMSFSGTDSQAQVQTTPTAPTYTAPSKVVDLDITIHSLKTDYQGFGTVVYTVKNTGDLPVDRLKVKIILLDASDTPLSVHTAYPNGVKILWPGREAVDDVMFMDYDMIGVDSVTIQIQDYREV